MGEPGCPGHAGAVESERDVMAEVFVVEEHNQDDMSRKAGCYLYVDTKLWLEDGAVHRGDGPAVVSPDGVERWYIRGKDVTREVKTFFMQNGWAVQRGLNTAEKVAVFQARF